MFLERIFYLPTGQNEKIILEFKSCQENNSSLTQE